MRIINVIEVTNGNIQSVNSWIVTDENEKEKVALAEAHYVSCVNENADEKMDAEDILEEDNYSNNSGYEVSLVWSHNVK